MDACELAKNCRHRILFLTVECSKLYLICNASRLKCPKCKFWATLETCEMFIVNVRVKGLGFRVHDLWLGV